MTKNISTKQLNITHKDRIKININGKDWWVTTEQYENLLKKS